jgi:hypothetical protein
MTVNAQESFCYEYISKLVIFNSCFYNAVVHTIYYLLKKGSI